MLRPLGVASPGTLAGSRVQSRAAETWTTTGAAESSFNPTCHNIHPGKFYLFFLHSWVFDVSHDVTSEMSQGGSPTNGCPSSDCVPAQTAAYSRATMHSTWGRGLTTSSSGCPGDGSSSCHSIIWKLMERKSLDLRSEG